MGGNQSEAHSEDWVRPSTEHKVKRNKCQRVREKPSFMDILCTHGRSWVWQKYKWCHGFSDMTRHRCRYVFDGWNNRMMIRWLSSRQDWWLIPGATPTLLWNKAFGCISDWFVAFRWISVLTSCISFHTSVFISPWNKAFCCIPLNWKHFSWHFTVEPQLKRGLLCQTLRIIKISLELGDWSPLFRSWRR